MSKTKAVTGQTLGYARVSTKGQKLDRQLDSLNERGCDKIFTDKATGNHRDRQGLKNLLSHIRAGDTVVFQNLDRVSRSLKDLLTIVGEIEEKECDIEVLEGIAKGINTKDPMGKMFFYVGAMFSEYESNVRKQRALAGVEAKKRRDPNYVHGRGSKPKVKRYSEIVKHIKEDRNNSWISRELKINRRTVIKARAIYLEEQGA